MGTLSTVWWPDRLTIQPRSPELRCHYAKVPIRPRYPLSEIAQQILRGTVMTISASVLQTLHRIQRQKSDLNGQLERGPKQIQAAKTKIEIAQKVLDDIREKQKHLRMDADRRQLQLREREQRIMTLETKLNQAKENREYQTLKEQIAADRQANNVLSDEILELLEQVDVVHAQIDPATNRVNAAKTEAADVERQLTDKMLVVEADLKRVLSELAEVEQQLSGDFKQLYDRLITHKGEDGIAETEGDCCGGCYQMLTPQLLDRLANQHTIVCPSCGRLLYQA